jgi:hypothetical protein
MTRMTHLVLRLAILISVAGTVIPVDAQELAITGGTIQNTDNHDKSYNWAIEYLHALDKNTEISFSYLNEGHFPDNHRDGVSVQLWARTRVIDPRLSLSVGIGPYLYFDTTIASHATSYDDAHDWGGVLSLAATWYTKSRWFYQLRATQVVADDSFNTLSISAGLGYQLEAPASPGPVTSAITSTKRTTENELTLYLGRSIVNSFSSESGVAGEIEYRRGIAAHVDCSIAWLFERDRRLVRRNGAMSHFWMVRDFLGHRLALSAGAGLYLAIDRDRDIQPGEGGDKTVSAVISTSASYRLNRNWLTRIQWNRIATNYNRDTDIILFGLGYRF